MKILFIANVYSHHISQFVSKLKENDSTINIDIFTISVENRAIPKIECYGKVFIPRRHFPIFFYRIPKVRGLIFYLDAIISFFKEVKDSYDLINIHNVTIFSSFVRKRFSRLSEQYVITPFGSDILRMKKVEYLMYKKLFKNADYITFIPTALKKNIEKKFDISKVSKVELDYGSDMLDLLVSNSIDSIVAKKNFSIENRYVIICGYNGYITQNHIKIIESLKEFINKLPKNYILIFPMTYGAPVGYIDIIENKLQSNGFKYMILKDFMEGERLFSFINCGDVLIHAQPTDNFSSSILEFLLAGIKLVNPSWLRYDILEKDKIPYYLYDDYDDIGKKLIEAIEGDVLVNDATKEIIESYSRRNMISKWIKFYKGFEQ